MENIKFVVEKSARIDKLVNDLYAKMPEIESARGILVTESYKTTEALPIIKPRAPLSRIFCAIFPSLSGTGAYRRQRDGRSARLSGLSRIFLRMVGSGV